MRGEISKRDFEYSDSSIRGVDETPKGTFIRFDFQDFESLLKHLSVSDDDANFAETITHGRRWGSGWNFRDPSTVSEDFRNGYTVYNELDDENLKKIREVLKVIDPGTNYDEFDQENSPKAYDALERVFPTETKDIVDEWYYTNEIACHEAAETGILKEVEDFLKHGNFKLVGIDSVKIEIKDLLKLFISTGKPWLSFRRLFKDFFNQIEETQGGIGGWMDNYYEWEYVSVFDKESFNRNISRSLDKMEDKIEDLDNIKEYIRLLNRITQKFKIGVTYNLPKNPEVKFRIKDIDREKMRINVVLRKGLKTITRSLSEENFYHLLYQPELFWSEFGSI